AHSLRRAPASPRITAGHGRARRPTGLLCLTPSGSSTRGPALRPPPHVREPPAGRRRAPITYVSAQLGHANPATTLRYSARRIPSRGQRWVDVLDPEGAAPPFAGEATLVAEVGTKVEPIGRPAGADDPEVAKIVGSPGRTR